MIITAILFILITLLAIAIFYTGTGKNKKVLLFSLGWTVIIGLLSCTGFFRQTDTMPPRALVFIIPTVILVITGYRTISTDNINIRWLTAIHILRIPVEIGLLLLFMAGKIPKIMTFEGWNYDILIGISALLLFYRKSPVWWNITGIIFLSVIVFTAILSAPSPIQQLAFDQPNIAILHFPFTLLPATIVPLVLLSHLLVLKAKRTVT